MDPQVEYLVSACKRTHRRSSRMENSPLAEEIAWRKSSYSGQNGGDCIEMAVLSSAQVLVRDSKDACGHQLAFTPAAWADFVLAATADSFTVVAP